MRNLKSDKLLREFVSELLKEESYEGLSMSNASMGPYGAHFGSGEQLYKVFIQPFADVIGTAAGKTKELSARAQAMTRIAFEAVATTLIPIYHDHYKEIFEAEKQQIDQIRSEYSQVYNSTWDAFRDNDVLVAAFMYSPAAVLTLAIAKKAPEAALKVLEVVSGGALDTFIAKIKNQFRGSSDGSSRRDDREGPGMPFESVIRELKLGVTGMSGEDAGQPVDRRKENLTKVLSQKGLRDAMQQSPIVKRMEQQGKKMVRGTLKQVYAQAQGVAKAQSISDLQKLVKKPIPGLDKLKKVPEAEQRMAAQASLASTKKAVKELYAKNLEAQVKIALNAGVPEESGFVQDYMSTIAKIRAL